MACIDRATPCPYYSPTFLRHKPSDRVYFFQPKIYPKFDMYRMHLLCLPLSVMPLLKCMVGKEPTKRLCDIFPPMD